MPLFDYKGLNSSGKNIRGTVDAENLRAARQKLKKDGVFVSDIKDKSKAKAKKSGKTVAGGSVPVSDLALMTRQLASLIKANIPLVDSLTAVSEQMENPRLRDAVADIKNQVNEGSSFYKGLSKYPKIFDNIFITMCEAGEATGTLDMILLRLAEFKEAQSALRSKVTSAMFYPIVMVGFTIIMLSVLFVAVIPKMQEVFENMEMTLPWYTEVVIGISGFMVNYWYILIIMIVATVFFFQTWKNSEDGSKSWDAIVLRLPVVGKMARIVAVSRFTRTLATLLQGGVPMLNALDIVRNVIDNQVLAEAVGLARDNISEGESIAGPLRKSGQFPPIVIHMINIGEKTGELESMLTQVSDSYDFEVKTKLSGFTAILEPLMILVMAVLVGSIVFSIMVPLFKMSSLGSQ